MRGVAQEAGLTSMQVADPHGLGNNTATIADACTLFDAFLEDRTLAEIAGTIHHDCTIFNADGQLRTVEFKNTGSALLNVPGCIAVKTGRTPEAQACLASRHDINGTPVTCVVLGAANRAASIVDTRNLIAWHCRNSRGDRCPD